ncbi:MAG TPA: alanine racemase, partial [Legionellaceae bacterium]|nr:alanine racemase [Legionellaceae bacterium]
MQLARPSYLLIDANALKHNIATIKQYAPAQQIVAMVKSNAYGCGLHLVAPILEPLVDAFGVACIEEAYALRQICVTKECVLMQGIFSVDELPTVVDLHLTTVIHNPQQLAWFVSMPQAQKLKVWVKVDTGMHRLGFAPRELPGVLRTLHVCPWIEESIGLMTHMACADTPGHSMNQQQLQLWSDIAQQYAHMKQSVANSAAIIALPQSHAQVIRPGLIIYGVSPFETCTGQDLGLEPVM